MHSTLVLLACMIAKSMHFSNHDKTHCIRLMRCFLRNSRLGRKFSKHSEKDGKHFMRRRITVKRTKEKLRIACANAVLKNKN